MALRLPWGQMRVQHLIISLDLDAGDFSQHRPSEGRPPWGWLLFVNAENATDQTFTSTT